MNRKKEIQKFLSRWLPQNPLIDPFDPRLIELARSRMTTLADYWPLIEPWFTFPEKNLCLDNGKLLPVANAFYVHLECVEDWTTDTVHRIILKMMEETGNKKIGKEITHLFTGVDHGLPLTDMLPIIGYIETQKRIVHLTQRTAPSLNL